MLRISLLSKFVVLGALQSMILAEQCLMPLLRLK